MQGGSHAKHHKLGSSGGRQSNTRSAVGVTTPNVVSKLYYTASGIITPTRVMIPDVVSKLYYTTSGIITPTRVMIPDVVSKLYYTASGIITPVGVRC